MTFNPSIPAGADDPSVSQGQLLTNFTQLGLIFGSQATADHYALEDATAALRGLHEHVTFPVVITDPDLADPAGSVYTKTVGGLSELYYQNNGAASEKQITGATTAAATGSTVICGGIIIKWGPLTSSGIGFVNTFVSPFPNFCWSVTASHSTLNAAVQVSGLGVADFTATAPFPGSGFYIAIGN